MPLGSQGALSHSETTYWFLSTSPYINANYLDDGDAGAPADLECRLLNLKVGEVSYETIFGGFNDLGGVGNNWM